MSNGILGIDCGTTKIAIVLIDPERQELLDARSAEAHAEVPGGLPSRRVQDVAAIEQVLRGLAQEVLGPRKVRLRCIGITGQMHGILGLNSDGRPVTPFVTWEDNRGAEQMKQGFSLLEEMQRRAGEQTNLASGYGIVTLYHWLRYENPPGLTRVCNIADYLAMLLTGNTEPVTDYTIAESLGCFDLGSSDWNRALMDRLGIPMSLLPRLSPPTEILGEAQAPWIRTLIREQSVPVCVAIGDNQASYLGSVREPAKSLLINIGTGSQICLAEGEVLPDSIRSAIDGLDVTLRPFVDSGFLVAGSALSGGVAYRALKDFFAAVGRDLLHTDEPDDLYQTMSELAERAGESAGLDFAPLVAGTRSDPLSRGSLSGISLDNLRPGTLIYAMQEGMVRILKELFEPEIIEGKPLLVGSGNGLRRNRLLRRIAARIFNRKLHIPQWEEEAAVGAALNGAVAAGVYGCFEEAREAIRYQESDYGV